MTSPSLWDPEEVRTWLLQLIGVPTVVILTINTLLLIATWLKAGHEAARTTSRVSLWVAAAARGGWDSTKPAVRFALTFAALAFGQAVAVALLYVTCRMLYSLPLVILPSDGSTAGLAWSTFIASVMAPPTEQPPWTLYAFLVALATAATLNAALALRAKVLRTVSEWAVQVVGIALWVVLFVVGGISAVVFLCIGLLVTLSGEIDDQGAAWLAGLALGAATGGMAYLTMMVGGFCVINTSDLLDPEDRVRLRWRSRSSA